MHPLEYFIRPCSPYASNPKYISRAWIFEKKNTKKKIKPKIPFFALSFAYRFRISFGTKCESTNLSLSFWVNESQTGDDFFTDSISDKILFTIMTRDHRTRGSSDGCNFRALIKKDHKFLWERGSRIEKYSSSFASNSSWLTGILKMSDEIRVRYRKKWPIYRNISVGNWQLWCYGLFW